MSVVDQPAGVLWRKLQVGELSARELTSACLARIDRDEQHVHAFLSLSAESALEAARDLDERRARGESVGVLGGLPVALKDVLCEAGQPVTCGSKMLAGYRSPYTSTVVARLRSAGGVIVGRTNMDEFAMGSSSENSAYGVTRNPWDLQRTPGGSSSGSAAAVAARFAPVSIGSDTGGSIRQPAGLCGVVGLKPTYGRVSRFGLVAYASSLDQVGPFANDVTGAAILLQSIAGYDPRDSTSIDQPTPDYLAELDQPLAGLRVGYVPEHFGPGLDAEVAAAVERGLDVYRQLGATVVPVELPHSRYAVATYYLIAPSEASSNLARYDGMHYGHRTKDSGDLTETYCRSRGEGFGIEVKRRIMLGTYALSSGYYDQFYVKALKVRRLIRKDYDEAFARVDVLAGPVTPTPAFPLGQFQSDPLAMYLSDIYTIGANLAGIPGLSLPAGWTAGGLPIGLQLLAAPFAEPLLLRAARMFELAAGVTVRSPVIGD